MRGLDGNKKLVGSKRHILVETEGFLLSMVVHAASIPDRKERLTAFLLSLIFNCRQRQATNTQRARASRRASRLSHQDGVKAG